MTELEESIMIKHVDPQGPDDSLATLRARIAKYEPGMISDVSLETAHINLGIFGTTASGKSALVNSLSFAVTGEYKEKCQEVSMSEVSIAGDERKEIALATCLQAFEIRKLRDLDTAHWKRLAQMKISNESEGLTLMPDPIHCPVFVYKYETGSIESAASLISTIREELECVFARNLDIMIVITHKEKLTNLEDVKRNLIELFQMPEENIWFFENYTKFRHVEDEEKSKQYLYFIWECLKKGESNYKLQKEGFKETKGRMKKEVAGVAGVLAAGTAAGATVGVVGGPVGMLIGGAVGLGVTVTGLATAANTGAVTRGSRVLAFMRTLWK